MPLTKVKKEQVKKETADCLKRASIVLFANFHGLSMPLATELRNELRNEGLEYKVIKKTILSIALKEVGYKYSGSLGGEIGVVIGYDEPTIAAKKAQEFAKRNKETFKLLGGIFEREEIDSAKVIMLASIPPREILLSQLLSVISSPMRGLVRTLNGVQQKFVFSLEKIKETKV